MKISANNSCPCGSTRKYKKCCKTFHDNITIPKTALELMKSRYCAYSVSNENYIISTTHKNNIDFSTDLNSWKKEILIFCLNTKFEKLEIIDFIEGEFESFVTFKAYLFQNDKDIFFIERSRFLKENNKWFYVDGKFLE